MTPALEQRLRQRLQVRAERLVKLAAMPHCPPAVLALASEHVTTTAMLLLGATFFDAVLRKLFTCLREQNGICMCGNGLKVLPDDVLCAQCLDECEADDRQIDEMVAMDAPAKGRPS